MSRNPVSGCPFRQQNRATSITYGCHTRPTPAYGAKYDKATACLAKDRAGLLTFYDFPAEHWKHLRTTNPIESTFATVRLRTIKTKGCLSRTTALTMVFKLCQSAAKKWRRLDGSHRLAEIVEGVKFKDGEKLIERAA